MSLLKKVWCRVTSYAVSDHKTFDLSIIDDNVVITTQFSIYNLYQNVLTKRDLLFTSIDSKKGNVPKNQIKIYINEIVNLIKSEKINYEKRDNSLIDITLTPIQNRPNLNNTYFNIEIEESVHSQNSSTNSTEVHKATDDYKNMSSEEKIDLIFHIVLDLTSKVDSNQIQSNCNPDQKSGEKDFLIKSLNH